MQMRGRWWRGVVLGIVMALVAPAAARAQEDGTAERVIMDVEVIVPPKIAAFSIDGSVGFCFEVAPGRLSVSVQLVGESQPASPAPVYFLFSGPELSQQVRSFPVTREETSIRPETSEYQCWSLRNDNVAPDSVSLEDASRYSQRVHLRMTWSPP